MWWLSRFFSNADGYPGDGLTALLVSSNDPCFDDVVAAGRKAHPNATWFCWSRLIDDEEFDARRRTRNGPWFITEDSVEAYEDDLDDEDDEDDDDYERGHSDGYKEALVECGDDDDDEDDD